MDVRKPLLRVRESSGTFEALRVRRLRNELSSKLCILRALLLVMLLCNFPSSLLCLFPSPLLPSSLSLSCYLNFPCWNLFSLTGTGWSSPFVFATFLPLRFSVHLSWKPKLESFLVLRPNIFMPEISQSTAALSNWSTVLPQAQNRVKRHRPFYDALLKWTLHCHEGLTRK